ncbi:MAG: hypothetical protein RL619_946, partial [Bacteroidota bacterium]
MINNSALLGTIPKLELEILRINFITN